jgi:hypothetical protein
MIRTPARAKPLVSTIAEACAEAQLNTMHTAKGKELSNNGLATSEAYHNAKNKGHRFRQSLKRSSEPCNGLADAFADAYGSAGLEQPSLF